MKTQIIESWCGLRNIVMEAIKQDSALTSELLSLAMGYEGSSQKIKNVLVEMESILSEVSKKYDM